jgi:hypothetical protein
MPRKLIAGPQPDREKAASLEKERPQGAFSRGLLEKDLAHVKMALPLSLSAHHDDLLLDSAYWRRRLYRILRQEHLSKKNLESVDTLLAFLDRHDATCDAT